MRSVRLAVEELEARTLLSSGGLTPEPLAAAVQGHAQPLLVMTPDSSPSAVSGYTPQQIRQAYGVNKIAAINNTAITGAGETIAIVDAYNDPKILSDANTFSSQFALPRFNTTGGPSLKVVTPGGGSVSGLQQDAGWAGEESLDVEWAHAIAPKANILLVEAPSSSLSDLQSAIQYVAKQAGVVAVSMSWGGPEFNGETSYDSSLQTPSGHNGVTFVASSGDSSAYYLLGGGPIWPATSPNVLAVGGTSLYLTSTNNYSSEQAWDYGGGGASEYENQPTFQYNTLGAIQTRLEPDVSYNADPNTGFAVYDSVPNQGYSGWQVVGGTSAGAPQWSAIVALADQAHHLKTGGASLDNEQVETTLYNTLNNSSQYAAAFHDVTSGSNGYYAGQGYDLATGLGTPKVNDIVSLLAGTRVAAGNVTTVGSNPGNWTGPSGSTPYSSGFGFFSVRAGGGSGMYVNAPSMTIAPNSAATNPSSATPGNDNVLISSNLEGRNSSGSLSQGQVTGSDSSSASAGQSATVFGASGWNGLGQSLRLSSLGFSTAGIQRVAGDLLL